MRSKVLSVAVLAILALAFISHHETARGGVSGGVRTYTVDADFDEGTLVGVEHETVHNQLQFCKEPVVLPFIWVPNEEDTVSKVDTVTGNELGRYRTGPPGFDGEPSRTTVDQQGNVWVANRYAGSVVKIGLAEAGHYVDRNGNGVMDTSRDINGDGNITGGEMLPWGQDECVLFEVVLIPNKVEKVFVPGTYMGGYTHDWTYPGLRSVAVDKNNNCWVGGYGSQKFYLLDGSTGNILRSVSVAPWNHTAYGAVMDRNGVLWSSGPSGGHLLRFDPSTDPPTRSRLDLGHTTYGVGLDYLNHLFVSGWTSQRLTRVNVGTSVIDWSLSKSELSSARGVVCTADNDVWVANTGSNRVFRYNNNGNLKASIPVGSGPTGVAVDAAGKVWVCHLNDDTIRRIDPATNSVDLVKSILGSNGHYCYSDMTGILSRTITTKVGTWTVVHDSGVAGTPWGTLCWNQEPEGSEPPGTSITVEARSSEDQLTWSAWETASNGVALSSTPPGRYLQIRATLKIVLGEVSPVLSDLTVRPANQPPVAVALVNGEESVVVEQQSLGGTTVLLDGSQSYDPDEDELTYAWDFTSDGTVDSTEAQVATTYPLGSPYTATLTVTDEHGASDTDTVTIEVVDTTPPEIMLDASMTSLWPPEHDLIEAVTLWVSDRCDAEPIVVISVTQDEPVEDQTGDGNFSPDAKFVYDPDGKVIGLRLRAERKGNGDGRVYLIIVIATDATGNVAKKCCAVTVPKSQSEKDLDAVAAQAAAAVAAGVPLPYDSTAGPEIGPKQ